MNESVSTTAPRSPARQPFRVRSTFTRDPSQRRGHSARVRVLLLRGEPNRPDDSIAVAVATAVVIATPVIAVVVLAVPEIAIVVVVVVVLVWPDDGHDLRSPHRRI